jgi:YD repeat-containing protein
MKRHIPGVKSLVIAVLIVGGMLFLAAHASARTLQNQYDELGRVTRVTYDSCTSVAYTYDPAGNITNTQVTKNTAGDTDCDGVLNTADRCPSTPEGEEVNSNGCTSAQFCPCARPLTGGTWKNHGDYVSCVSDATGALVRADQITDGDKSVIVSAAAQSSCGNK